MIVARGRVKYIIFDSNIFTIEKIKDYLKKNLKSYRKRGIKNEGRIIKYDYEIDNLKMIKYKNWFVFEYDKNTKTNNLEICENYLTSHQASHYYLIDILDELC